MVNPGNFEGKQDELNLPEKIRESPILNREAVGWG